jgi:uncharacterized protein (TIGR02597 family)
MKLLLTISSALVAASLAFNLHAQSVTTDPVGYVTLKLAGENVGVISQGLHQPIEFAGTPSSVSTNVITFSGVNFQEILGSGPYGIDFQGLSGNGYVLPVTSFNSTSLTISEDISTEIDGTVSVGIRQLLTIADVFGTGESLILQAGTPLTADRVLLRDPLSNGLIICFYSSGGLLGTGWRIFGQGPADASNTLIIPGEGMRVVKKSVGDLELIFTGSVRSNPMSINIPGGVTPLSTSFPIGTTLGNSGLFNPEDPNNSLTPGTPLTADRLLVDSNGDGNSEVYFYSSGGLLGVGWRAFGMGPQDMSNVSIDNGFVIIRRSEQPISITFSSPISQL